MEFGSFWGILVLLAFPTPSTCLEDSTVFGEFLEDYSVGRGLYDQFDYAVVKVSPCDGVGYGFAIHRYWETDEGCQEKVVKFSSDGASSVMEIVGDATGGGYEYCYGVYLFSIDFEYVNEQCDVSLAVKVRAHSSSCAYTKYGSCYDNDDTYDWILAYYTASSPYSEADLMLSKTWSGQNRYWGEYFLESRGIIVCDSSAEFYYVYPSADASEFCLMNVQGTKCFCNDPPLQAGSCYADGGEHFYVGLFYLYRNNKAIYVKKFALSESNPLNVFSFTLSDYIYQSDIIVVEKGWDREVVAVISYESESRLHLLRLDADLNYLGGGDIAQNYPTEYPSLFYRSSDGFLFLVHGSGRYIRQLSLFTSAYSDVRDIEFSKGICFHGTVSAGPDPTSSAVYGAFGLYYDGNSHPNFYFFHSVLSVARPVVVEPLPDLHYRMDEPEEFPICIECFEGVDKDSDFNPFQLRETLDNFSFVHFDSSTQKFTGTAPSLLFPTATCDSCFRSEEFYMRVYSGDEVFTETSFTVYAHQFYVFSRGTQIPTVSYENGKVVNTTINLLDYFYISGAPDFGIEVVPISGLPEGVSLALNVTERIIQFSGTVPGEVDECRNPYPINVAFSDCCTNYTTQFVFETTKFRPVINIDVVNETTHYLPPRSMPIGSGININVDNCFVELAGGEERTIRYTARLRDGSPLPTWLEFDPDTRMFSGFTPSRGCYDLDIEIIGLNDCGLGRSVYLNFSVTNQSPSFDGSLCNITDQTINAGDKGSFVFDAACFEDEDSSIEGPLVFEYRTRDGGGTEVSNPEWLSMAYLDGMVKFDYDVPSACGAYVIEIYGYDTCRLNPPAVSTPFSITITNKAPVLINPIGNFTVNGGEYFNISIPPDTFRDPEGFDLAYQALQVTDNNDTELLPIYITFDVGTLSFSGECNTGINETIRILLEASDGCSIASTEFSITVVYLPSSPTPVPEWPRGSDTGEIIAVLGSSLAISVSIGIGAFGFKTHRKEVERKRIIKAVREAKNENPHLSKRGTLSFKTAPVCEAEKSISGTESEYVLEDLEEAGDRSSITESESIESLTIDTGALTEQV